MKVLALEFSSPQRSVAVVRLVGDGGPAAGNKPASLSLSEVVETGAHATHALGMIEAALREAQLEREQVECLAIGLGPGSYTGIRAAIAVAQGWQLASGTGRLRLLGISTVECLAAQVHAERILGRIALVLDAQRNEFYLAEYEVDTAGWRLTSPLRLATAADVEARLEQGALLLGPEVTRWFPTSRVLYPRAATLGQLAAGRTDFVAGEKLEPIYLRETTFVKAPPPRTIPA